MNTKVLNVIPQHTRCAVRALARTPALSVVCILTLGLAIGSITAVFSIVDATILKPLPFHRPYDLYAIYVSDLNGTTPSVSSSEYQHWVQYAETFDAIITIIPERLTVSSQGASETLNGASVPAAFFEMLGAEPVMGRTFLPDEDRPEADPVVVLGYNTWEQVFGEDPNILGRSILLGSYNYTVVGILPKRFDFPFPGERHFWLPLNLEPRKVLERSPLRVYGRLKADARIDWATEELTSISRDLASVDGEPAAGRFVTVRSLQQMAIASTGNLPLILFGAAVLVLLVTIANVTNIVLSHLSYRRSEIATRSALGGSTWHVAQQFLTESLLLSLLGGILGLACASSMMRLIVPLIPRDIPRAELASIDLRVAGFAMMASVLVALLISLYPVWTIRHFPLSETLNQASHFRATDCGRSAMRRALTVVEVAMAVVLCVAAGLLFKTLLTILGVNIGVNPQNVVTFHIPSESGDRLPDMTALRYRQLIGSAAAVPGVIDAAVTSDIPLKSAVAMFGASIEVPRTSAQNQRVLAHLWCVSPSYFNVMGIRLVRGRLFTEEDTQSGSLPAILSERTAESWWPGEDPLLKRLTIRCSHGTALYTVVGIVGDVKPSEVQAHSAAIFQVDATVYLSLLSEPTKPPPNQLFLVARTSSDPRPLIPEFRRAIWSASPGQLIQSVDLLEDVVNRDLEGPRFRAGLFGFFAAIATMIAAVGVYGQVSQSVAARRHDFGVHLSLGAQPKQIVFMIIREGLGLTLVGILCGFAAALALQRLIDRFLVGGETIDGALLSGTAVLMCAVAVLACWIPARRAAAADPLDTLRS